MGLKNMLKLRNIAECIRKTMTLKNRDFCAVDVRYPDLVSVSDTFFTLCQTGAGLYEKSVKVFVKRRGFKSSNMRFATKASFNDDVAQIRTRFEKLFL